MAVRLAFLEAPTDEMSAVMQVPMFWPIISGMAMLKETTPVVLMAWSMPIEAEELWSRAVTAAPTATPRRGLEKAVNTDWNSGRFFSGSTAEDMVFMPMNSRPRPSTIWPTMRLCPPLMNM
jgi:hypothetical protein